MKIELLRPFDGLDQKFIQSFERELFSPFSNHYETRGRGLKSWMVALLRDEGDSDDPPLIYFRVFINNHPSENQRYILSLKFANFGDTAMIDLVSLSNASYQEIIQDYLKGLQVRIMFDFYGNPATEYNSDVIAPVMLTGGRLRIDPSEKIFFFKSRTDEERSGFFKNAAFIGSFIVNACFSEKFNYSLKRGRVFVGQMMKTMFLYRGRPDFYEKFIDEYLDNHEARLDDAFNENHLNSLLAMKVIDRVVKNRSDEDGRLSIITKIVDQELDFGFANKLTQIRLRERLEFPYNWN